MANAREFDTKLETFKVNMNHDHIDFSAIESLLLNPDYRALLNKDRDLFDKFTLLYKQAISILTDEIYQISLYRFVAITPEELERIDAPLADPVKSPQYSLYIRNCEGLLAYVFHDIMQYEEPLLILVAYKRWALIMTRLVSLNDFASAFQIYGVLENTLGSFKAFLDKKTLGFIEYMNKIFDRGIYKFESLRDQYLGRAIPLVANYSSYIAAVRVSSTTDKKDAEASRKKLEVVGQGPHSVPAVPADGAVDMKEKTIVELPEVNVQNKSGAANKLPVEKAPAPKELTPHQRIVINKTVSTIKHLQAACAIFMGIKYEEAMIVHGFKENRIFATEEDYNTKITELVIRRVERNIAGLNKDDLRYKLVMHRKEILRSVPKSKLTLEFNDALIDRCSSSVSQEQVGYYEHIHALREYSRSKAIKEEASKRRADLTAFLGDLSFETRILEKINLIKGQLDVYDQVFIATKNRLFRPEVVRMLKDIINQLNARADNERKAVSKIIASKLLNEGISSTFTQAETGEIFFTLKRLNLSNTKTLHTEPIKKRVQLEPSENQMSWVRVLEMTSNASSRNLSDSDSKNSDDDRIIRDEGGEVPIIPSTSNLSSPSASPQQGTPRSDTSPKLSPATSTRRLLDLQRVAVDNSRRSSQGGDDVRTSPLESPNSSEQSPPTSAHGKEKGGLVKPVSSNTTIPEARYRVSRGMSLDKAPPPGGVLRKTRSSGASEAKADSSVMSVGGSQAQLSTQSESCSPPPPLTFPISPDSSGSGMTEGSSSPSPVSRIAEPPTIDTPNADAIREELLKAGSFLAEQEQAVKTQARRDQAEARRGKAEKITADSDLPRSTKKSDDDKKKKRRSIEGVFEKLRDVIGVPVKSSEVTQPLPAAPEPVPAAMVTSVSIPKNRPSGKPLDSEGMLRRQNELISNEARDRNVRLTPLYSSGSGFYKSHHEETRKERARSESSSSSSNIDAGKNNRSPSDSSTSAHDIAPPTPTMP